MTLGYPTLTHSIQVIKALEDSGADLLEIGFPFSDPLADGPTIQRASQEAIEKGIQFQDFFKAMRLLRKNGLKVPVLLFSYFNPIFHYGVSRTARELFEVGCEGAIVPDLPPEEGRDLEASFRKFNLSLVYLVAPTTSHDRMKMIAQRSSGFVYYVSLRGVTGVRRALPHDLTSNLKVLRSLTNKPILVGFGISTPKQARQVCRMSDGVVVGSAILNAVRKSNGRMDGIKKFTRSLVDSVRSAE